MAKRKGESDEEYRARSRAYEAARRADPAYRAKAAAYRNTPERRARDKLTKAAADRARNASRTAEERAARSRYVTRGISQIRAWIVQALGARCGICETQDARICVDHDHTTGAVRGALCHACNAALGHFEAGKHGRPIPGWSDAARRYLAQRIVVRVIDDGESVTNDDGPEGTT